MSRKEIEKISKTAERLAVLYNQGSETLLFHLTGIKYAMIAVEGDMVIAMNHDAISNIKFYYGTNEISIDIPTNL